MKIKNIENIFLLILTMASSTCVIKAVNEGTEKVKQPSRILEVRGTTKRKHSVIHLTITQNPTQETSTSGEGDSTQKKPLIQRSLKGVFGGEAENAPISVYTDVTLRVPEKQIEFKSDIPDMVAKMAGAIPDPSVKMAFSAAATLVNAGLEIAGNELTKKYGIDPTTISMVEILPNQYYRIDTGTGKISTTPEFDTDLPKYTELMQKYIPIAEAWNTALRPYNKAINQWRIADPLQENEEKIAELQRMYKETVEPALKKRLEIETELLKYSLYRYAIMAVNTAPGTSCEAVGGGCKGPWQLYVYFFLGAKQTNVFEIDFCVPDKEQIQDFIVELIPNFLDSKGNFQAGGLRLVTPNVDKPNISFPKQEGTENINLRSRESRKLSWNDEMLVDANADVPGIYAFPFDVYKLKAEFEKQLQGKADEASKKRLEDIDKAVNEFKEAYPKYKEEKKTADEEKAEKAKAAKEAAEEKARLAEEAKAEKAQADKDAAAEKAAEKSAEAKAEQERIAQEKKDAAEKAKQAAADAAKKKADEARLAAEKAKQERLAAEAKLTAEEKAKKAAEEKAKKDKEEADTAAGLGRMFNEE